MSGDAWFTLVVLVVTVGLLAMDRFPPVLVMGGSLVVLFVTGVIDEEAALSGFSNSAVITVAALYVLAGAADITGALEGPIDRVLGHGAPIEGDDRPRAPLAKLGYASMALSAFIANTPLVSIVAPRVVAWCRRTGRSPSRFLMPLSYAIIFGGCITVIGTSTNLLVSQLMEDAGQRPLDVFEITGVGLPVAIAGVTLMVLIGPRFLAARLAPSDIVGNEARRFTIEMKVVPESPLAGRTVTNAGLRNLEGVFLVEVERDGRTIAPVTPQQVIAAGDRLTFVGDVSRVLDLQRMPGLVSAEERHFEVLGRNSLRQFYEAVVGSRSSLVGATLKEVGFRGRYESAVVAIHRSGERLAAKLGDVRLRPGDVLLVLGGTDFGERWRDYGDFALVAALSGSKPVRRESARVVELAILGLVVVAGTGLLDLLTTSVVLALGLVVLGIITPGEARQSVNLDVVLLMATSIGVALAINESGLARELAALMVDLFEPFGDLGLLVGVLAATMVMTELLSNNAAAALMFPIAVSTAAQAGLDPRPFAVIVLFGATLSFLTPIGYQTNTIVWGMGGYRYGDFARLGAPLTLLTLLLTPLLVAAFFPLR